jgi:hypothetical protein
MASADFARHFANKATRNLQLKSPSVDTEADYFHHNLNKSAEKWSNRKNRYFQQKEMPEK